MALYLKYRPKDFDSIVGQDFVKNTLKKAVETEKTVGAYLLCGPRGTGKTSTARIFAKAINCENPNKGNPCNSCKICEAINNESLVDFIEIDAASNTGVDNIREIIEKAQYKPTNTKFKIYIIDEVHMLSKGAFNALLKILEEPPSYLKFILATTETHKVPETIVSRCQRYDFKNISINDIKERLKFIAKNENIKIDEKSLDYIANNSSGALRNAISLFEQLINDNKIIYENIVKNLGITDSDFLENFLEKLEKSDSSIVDDFDKLIEEGKNIKLFFKDLIFYTKQKTLENLKQNQDISKLFQILETLDKTYSKTKNSLDENTTFLIGILKIINGENQPSHILKGGIEDKNQPSHILKGGIEDKNPPNPLFKGGIDKVKDKCVYSDIEEENNNEELDINDIGEVFGENPIKRTENGELRAQNSARGFSPLSGDENPLAPLSDEIKEEKNSDFIKENFLGELKEAGVKGLIISSLKQSEIKLENNELIIKFKTNFVKNQFNNEENIASVKEVLNNMGFKDVVVKLL